MSAEQVPPRGPLPVFQDDAQRRTELAADIAAASFLRGDFVLSSGVRSDFYLDKYLFETRPTILRRLAALMADRIPGGVDRLAGIELGAVPLTTALSLETGLPFVVLRRAHKPAAGSSPIEGELHRGERILLVEDVVSTGGQARTGVRALRRTGAVVAGVLAVVDRRQGAANALAADGVHLDALYDIDELPIPHTPLSEIGTPITPHRDNPPAERETRP